MKFPEQNRIDGFKNSDGIFLIDHFKIIGYKLFVIASNGFGWEHVSISIRDYRSKKAIKPVARTPNWSEMCFIKQLFWHDDESVMQLHPPKSEWINNHNYCLHLWKPIGIEIPLPPSIMVGIKN
jgi:hypothetical protein